MMMEIVHVLVRITIMMMGLPPVIIVIIVA